MRRSVSSALIALILLSMVMILAESALAKTEPSDNLIVLEWYGRNRVTFSGIPPNDDSMSNPHYQLLGVKWSATISYWINPKNKYGFGTAAVVTAVSTSADTWDKEATFQVFRYRGTTSRAAGRRDGYNVVSWGAYSPGAIAVTYIWYSGSRIVETDCRMNTYYSWSLSGGYRKMDVKDIMTHEFGHWCGLADLYSEADYWLTMYGYANYGETYKQTLGLGDINGLEAVYGP